MKILAYSIIVSLLLLPYQAWTENSYDGTKPLLCASIEAIICEPGEPCEKDLPERVGAPQFMRVDFSKKEIIGPKRTTTIRLMEKTDRQLMLQGFEFGMGWTFAIDRTNGKMMATLVGAETAFVVFGACMPLP